MSQTAAYLEDHVIPHGQVRLWVLSLPSDAFQTLGALTLRKNDAPRRRYPHRSSIRSIPSMRASLR